MRLMDGTPVLVPWCVLSLVHFVFFGLACLQYGKDFTYCIGFP